MTDIMPTRIPLETGIYRILSDEKGLSRKVLLNELEKYSKKLKEHDRDLRVNGGALSKKLKELREERNVVYEYNRLYYIKKDLNAFTEIIKDLAKSIENASYDYPLDPRKFILSSESKDKDSTKPTLQHICSFIKVFIRSPYTRELIKDKNIGMKSIYPIYKKEVHEIIDDCGLEEFIEHARSLIHEGSITNLSELGDEFKSDAAEVINARQAMKSLFKTN